MNRGAWWATLHEVTKSRTQLSDFHFHHASVFSSFTSPLLLFFLSLYNGNNKSTYIYFCLIDYAKAFNYVDNNKLWNILKEMGIADHLT